MEYLVATIVIMLFCITALAQDRTSESAVIISRDKPKPLKPGKEHVKHMVKPVYLPVPVVASGFTGQLCFDTIAKTGGGAVNLLLPVRQSVLAKLELALQNYRHVLLNSRLSMNKLRYIVDFVSLK